MTTIKELSIPETQLKLRWREPYVTDGTNKALAVLDPGAYRGGYVRETDPISTSFRITAEGEQDNHFLWVDKTSGAALSIRYGTDVLVDMSDLFTGPGGTLPSAQTWYVWIDCAYTVGGATSGKIYVGDAAPSSANAVKLARISMPNGATAILDSYIDVSTTYRTVAHVDRPILLARRVSRAVSTNKFQITGKVYMPNGSVSFAARDFYINLSGDSGLTRVAYTGDDGAFIWVKQVWADSGLSVAITSDSEGFIADPWVELDVSQTTDPTPPTCYVRYWTRGTLRDLILDDQIKADWMPHDHAVYVATREKAGSPTSLTKGSVQSQLEELLTAVNDRISERAPESAPASPVLLWRSHNVASDALVTGTTISIYWGSTLGFAVIVGGYISGANAVRALVTPGDQMVLLRLHGNIGAGPELLSSPASAGATVAWNDPTAWTAVLHTSDVGGIPLLTIPLLVADVIRMINGALRLENSLVVLTDDESYIGAPQPGIGGRDTFCRLFESTGSGSNLRLYYGADSFWLTFNAYWSAGKWHPDLLGQHAVAIGVGLVGYDPSFFINKKLTSNFGSGWVSWDNTIGFGTVYDPDSDPDDDSYINPAPIVGSGFMERCRWALAIRGPNSSSCWDYCPVTMHAQSVDVPNFAYIYTDYESIPLRWSDYEVTHVDVYGVIVGARGDVNGLSGTLLAYGGIIIGDL